MSALYPEIHQHLPELPRSLRPEMFPVIELPPLFPRSHTKDIFLEGEALNSIEAHGEAMACATLVASPHTTADITQEKFLAALQSAYGEQVVLPQEAQESALFSPQLLIWIAKKGEESEDLELYDIAAESAPTQHDFNEVIGKSVSKAVTVIEAIAGKPTIWGSWGFATAEEQLESGLSRGGPTIKKGHIHVTAFKHADSARQISTLDIPRGEVVDYRAPLYHFFYGKHGESFARIIHMAAVDSEVQTDSTDKQFPTWKLCFNNPLPVGEAFIQLAKMGNEVEQTYKHLRSIFESFQTHTDRMQAIEEIKDVLEPFGLSVKAVNELVQDILAMQPTYAQLRRSADTAEPDTVELINRRLDRYERIRDKLAKRSMENLGLFATLVNGALIQPQTDPPTTLTMPFHASFSYMIDDYELGNNGSLTIRSVQLYPELGTSKAASERKHHALLRRSISVSDTIKSSRRQDNQ